MSLSSSFHEQILPFHPDQTTTHRSRRRSAKDSTGDHVELAAVAWTRHHRSVQLALRQRTPPVGAPIVERVQVSLHIRHAHCDSRDIVNAHETGGDTVKVTNSRQHTLHRDLTGIRGRNSAIFPMNFM